METQHLVCISRNIFTFYDTLFFVSRHPLRAVIASVNNLEFTLHISIFHLSQDDPRQHHDSVKTVTHSAIWVASKLFLYYVSQQTTVSFRKLIFIDGDVECLVSSGLIWPLTSLRLSFTADSSRSDAAFVFMHLKKTFFDLGPIFHFGHSASMKLSSRLTVSSLKTGSQPLVCLSVLHSLTPFLVPAAVQTLAYLTALFACSALHYCSLLWDRRPTTGSHTRTHISWSSCRTRGGGKRVEEFGLVSRNCLRTAGNVELMSFCLSVCLSSSPFCRSVGLPAWRWQVNTCSSCCISPFS